MASIESELASLQRVQDRVQSAKSEDLPAILAALIPKLVALANQDALRAKTISVLSECMKRLRLAKLPIDLSGILGSIHPRMLPFAANLAVSFVDVAIEYGVSKTSQKEAVSAVLSGLSEFASFSSQSNALCYYAIEYLAVGLAAHATSGESVLEDKAYKQAQGVLGDFAIDIAMLQRPLIISNEQSAVGSVQPGLSASRVERLTCKKKAWTAVDLKATKLQLINLIPTGIFLPQHAAFISIVLSNDADAEVATQAAFKMNGCANMLHIDKDPVVAAEVVVSLLSYCSQAAVKPNAPVVVNVHKRSLARADVRLSTLRWLVRHLSAHLTSSAKAIVTQLFQCVFAPSNGAASGTTGGTTSGGAVVAAEATSVASALTEEVAVIAASLQLLQALLERCEATLLTDKVMLILLCVKRVLQSFAYSTTSFAAGEHHVAVRLSSYCIIEEVANKFRALRKQVTEAQVNAMALQASEAVEEEQQVSGGVKATGDSANERSVHSAVTASNTTIAITATAKAETDALAMYGKVTIEDATMLLLLFQLLDREHTQRNESSILALYRAMNSLREAYILIQHTPALIGELTSDATVILSATSTSTSTTGGLSAEQARKLQDLLRSVRRPDKDAKMRLAALQWSAALFQHDMFVIETAYLLADDSSESVVTAAVAEFARLRAYLQDTISPTAATNTTAALSTFLPVLLSVLTLLVDTPEVVQSSAHSSDTEGKSSITGLHYLLDSAAVALRLLHTHIGTFSTTERNSLLQPHAPLLARVIQVVASIPLLRSSNVTIYGILAERTHDAFFTSQRAAQAVKANNAAPEVENIHHNNNSNGSVERVTVGTASTAGKLSATRVTESLNPHLLRSVSAVTYSLLQLCDSTSANNTANGSIATTTYNSSVVLDAAKECIPQYLTWLALPEYDIRTEVASIFAVVCRDNVNVASNLVRQLTHKLSVLHSLTNHSSSSATVTASNTTTTATSHTPTITTTGLEASPANLRAAAGALRCLGSIVAQLALSVNNNNNNQHINTTTIATMSHSEVQHIADQLLTYITQGLLLDSTARTEHCLLQVVALEVLHELVTEGLAVKTNSTSMIISAGEVTISLIVSEEVMKEIVKLLHHRDYRIAVPTIHVYSTIRNTSTTNPTNIDNNINNNNTDTTTSITDVLACWAEIMTPTLRANEHHCVKFAWAEAMVYLCAQSSSLSGDELLVVASASVGNSKEKSDVSVLCEYLKDTHTVIDGEMPLLLEYLLHLIDTTSNQAVSAATASERSTYCVALLVLVKVGAGRNTFSAAVIRKIVEVFLRFMRDKDLFVQDICCVGLCHLYNYDTLHSADPTRKEVTGLTGPAGQPVSVSEYVAYEVMVTLMRERRAVQPVGYSAGSSSTSAGTAQAQARERAAAQPATPAETGAVAGGGGGGGNAPAQDNHLMLAAVAAAAELGVGLQFGTGGEELGAQQQQADQLPQDYVVYATICKMAKQAKDSSILFAVLALIKRDPTFGTGPSRQLAAAYAAPAVHLSSSKLIEMLPLLYHARFDPNTTVRPVMRELWETLMDAHFPQGAHLQLDLVQRRVVAFLVSKLSSPVWRDREAACLALEAFLPRRAWAVSVFPLLEELFHSALRALDDMRDSTRGAALAYTKALSSHIVRACNSEQSPEPMVTSAVDKIVPLLLEKGLVAPSAEARGVSLGLLGKVVEAAKSAPALRKWLARIISVLVEGMSALEPQTLQYMQFHTARLRISDEELEGMRIKMAQSSPLQEALEICLTSLHQATAYNTNATTIPEVMQGLSQQLQRGVGLATRVAAAQSLSQLAERYAVFLGKGSSGAKPAAEAFQCIIWSLTQAPHMAVTLKKAMTSAFGALCKVVDEEVLASECEQLVRKYSALQRDQLDQSLVLAQCIQQIVQRGGSRLEDGVDNRTELWDRLLSCAYLGSHDSDAESKAVWTATWQETLSASGVGTKLSALLRILPQLLGMVHAVYKELSWHRRLQAVQVLREILDILPAEALVTQLNQVSEQFTSLLTTLLVSIPGQVWAGQAAVLEVVSELMSRCKAHVSLSPLTLSSSEDIVIPVLRVGDQITSFSELTGGQLGKHMSEQIAHDCVGLSSSAPFSSNVPAADPIWSLSFLGWALLLVHESRRGARNNNSVGEAEYRQSAARALSLLPWSLLAVSVEGTATFAQLLPLLCRQSGIPPYAPAALLPVDASLSGSSAEGAIKADSRPNKRLLGNAALFGVRYRQFNEAGTSRKVATTAVAVESNTDVGDVVESEAEPEAESSEMLVESDVLTTPLDHTMEVENQHEPSIIVEETESLQELTAMVVTSAEDIETAALLEDGAAVAEAYVSYEHKHPPVYHIYYLECLLRGWPRDFSSFSSSSNNSSVDAQLSECLQHLLDWAQHCMHTAVWSVRKAAVQLIGTVCSARQVTEAQCESTLLIIELALNEQKFIKVRVEALKSLALLLQSANRGTIDNNEGLKGRVRELIRNASTDSQPTILEAVSKVQNLWLK